MIPREIKTEADREAVIAEYRSAIEKLRSQIPSEARGVARR